MNRSDENLDQLLKSLYKDRAESVKQDLLKGDELFARNPAPAPGPEVIDDIKQEVSARLRRRRIGRRTYTALISSAAAVFIAVGLMVLMSNRPRQTGQTDLIAVDWNIDDSAPSSAYDRNLQAQITRIQQEIIDIKLGSDESRTERLFEQVETDLEDLNDNFWKG